VRLAALLALVEFPSRTTWIVDLVRDYVCICEAGRRAVLEIVNFQRDGGVYKELYASLKIMLREFAFNDHKK
jgi:hypothetical protein